MIFYFHTESRYLLLLHLFFRSKLCFGNLEQFFESFPEFYQLAIT
jgi:hypothetical protein